ncbi:MAG: bifunctional folylpolyglutamate synthase/dihydrofolate synthase [Rhodospirillaceae bacterium]|nr:bifunctional folylpolyglutamate synthase/dihydrofolate synthase [Rhodospirillaceae bacterium]
MGTSVTDADESAIAAILARFVRYHPDRIDLSLDRMHRLLSDLENPQNTLPPVIHIAGTNGKGSTTAFLDSALTAAGLRVSAYTSPHLVRFAERYKIAGEIMSDAALRTLFEEIEDRNAGKPITEFEITTAASFLAMARTPADVVLLETGLGGQFDATNVDTKPAATIITPVGYDHMGFLGDTLAAIAGEKAAIQKPGVPSFVAPQAPEAAAVISAFADDIGAPLYRAGHEWQLTATPNGGGRYTRGETIWNLPEPGLPGRHQLDNAALATACLDVCGFPGITQETIQAGLARARWPGRMQRLTSGPLPAILPDGAELWLDAAHNPMGATVLAEAFGSLETQAERPLHLVVAMLDDKDIAGFLAPFAARAISMTAVPLDDEPRAMPVREMVAAAEDAGLAAKPAGSVADALTQITQGPMPVRVLVTGSHLLVGATLRANN